MLTYYILLALLVFAVIAIVMLWSRLRSAEQANKMVENSTTGPATVVRVDTLAELGDDATRAAANFDPSGTMIYRSSQAAAPGASAKRRDEAAAPPEPPVAARLVCMSGHHKGTTFPVIASGMTIGRSPRCDIVLVDPRVSSRHAWIGLVDGQTILRDLKSTNGTFLNAHIHASVSEVPLHSGDTISFGGHQGDQFRYLTS
jgi:hypothetical protein